MCDNLLKVYMCNYYVIIVFKHIIYINIIYYVILNPKHIFYAYIASISPLYICTFWWGRPPQINIQTFQNTPQKNQKPHIIFHGYIEYNVGVEYTPTKKYP